MVDGFQKDQNNVQVNESLEIRFKRIIERAKQAGSNEAKAEEYKSQLDKEVENSKSQQARIDSIKEYDLKIASDLVAGFHNYLNFDIPAELDQKEINIKDYKELIDGFLKEKPEFKRFKIRLSQGIQALEEALKDPFVTQRADVLDALNIVEISEKLNELFSKIKQDHEKWNDWDTLWNEVILSGLNDNFLHYLLRADRLLQVYFINSEKLRKLKNAVSACANAFESIFKEIEVNLYEVKLLEIPSKHVEFDSKQKSIEKIKKVSEIKNLIIERKKELSNDLFVVDITFFGTSGRPSANEKVEGILHSLWDWTEN